MAISTGFGGYPISGPITLPSTVALTGLDAFFQTIGSESVGGDFVISNGTRARLGLN